MRIWPCLPSITRTYATHDPFLAPIVLIQSSSSPPLSLHSTCADLSHSMEAIDSPIAASLSNGCQVSGLLRGRCTTTNRSSSMNGD